MNNPTPVRESPWRPYLWAGVGALGMAVVGALATRAVMETPSTAAAGSAVVASGSTPARPKPVASRCDSCGVVEAVTPVQVKGEGTGLGAAAGGVLGGVIGHQMGGGRGKDAMTVIGAVGGGMAGHEIEKRQRTRTAYQLRVRMADGSLRTLTQADALAVGQTVRLEGGRVVPAAS